MVSELRWASILAKVTDGNYQAGPARDVFNAATLGGCRFIERDDLGRLAPGAKADILLINLDHVGERVYADPIKALVDAARGATCDTVIVDGETLVQDGRPRGWTRPRSTRKAREATQHYWSTCRLALGRRATSTRSSRPRSPSTGRAEASVARAHRAFSQVCVR